MKESSRDYTSFSTPFGCLKWLHMPMVLTGSPPTFQSLIRKVFVGLTWKKCMSYFDDVIISSSSPKEHLERLKLVLERLHPHQRKINRDNCDFFKIEIRLFRYMASQDGLQADPNEVKAVQMHAIPKSQTEVKSLLSLASYYRRFVPKIAEIARP